MSVDRRTIMREARRDSLLDYELRGGGPLRPETLAWMQEHGKAYRPETLGHFGVSEAWLTCYRREAKRKRSLWTSRVINIPAGLVTRCYRFEEPSRVDRWRCTPTGYPPQFIGDLSGPDILLCEGEWDCLCAFDHGFKHAATHTAGAGNWLLEWTPMFKGKCVWICYDRDAIGMKGAARVARALWPVAASVRMVDLPLPGTPEAKDVSDFFRFGGTAKDFQKLLDGARHYARRTHSPGRGSGLRAGIAYLAHS